MKRFLHALVFVFLLVPAVLSPLAPLLAQNTICPTAAPGDSSNKCASTAFVQGAIGGGPSGPAGGDLTGTYPNPGIAAGAVTNAKLAPGAANTVKGSLNGTTTSDLAMASCSAAYQFTQWLTGTGWQCGINPVLPSRAVAATLNLSAYSAVTTQGYTTPGDGGGAVFKNVGSAPFIDSFVTGGTITNAGSGYVNGTYHYVQFAGGTGVQFIATVVISGGVVTSVTCIEQCGNAYTPLDVLTASNAVLGGSGAGLAYRIDTVSAPKASFTASGGAHLQYVVDAGRVIDPRAFGTVMDYAGVQGSATDSGPAILATLGYAAYTTYPRQDLGGTLGQRVVFPNGATMSCSQLIVPASVSLDAQGPMQTSIQRCDSLSSGLNFVELGDPNGQVACFGVQISNIKLNASLTATASNSTYLLHTNCAQQDRMLSNVAIYSGKFGCYNYNKGYGGAALVSHYDLFCTIATGASSDGVVISPDVGTTILGFDHVIVEAGGAGYGGNGFVAQGGVTTLERFHSEGVVSPIFVNITVAGLSLTVKHATGGGNCGNLVTLQGTNLSGNFSIEHAVKQGVCTNLVLDGQSGGSNRVNDLQPYEGILGFHP